MRTLATLPDHAHAGALARHLFGADVAVASLDPRVDHGDVWNDEWPVIEGAVARRQLEYAAGRSAARQAMASLGVDAAAIPSAEDRAPMWPRNLVGSISHCATACVAVVARSSEVASLGIDIEQIETFDEQYLDIVCTGVESDWLRAQHPAQFAQFATLVFSAKECAYKCQYPFTHQLFGFECMTVEIDIGAMRFATIFNRAIGEFRAGHRLTGRFAVGAGMVLTGMTMRQPDLPRIPEGWAR